MITYLDQNDTEIIGHTEVDVGEYAFEDFDTGSMSYGTMLIADDVHPTFVRSFQKSLTFDKFKDPPLEWSKALRIISGVHSLQELGDYWRLLWELSAACPVTYLSERALPNKLIAEEQQRLQDYDFKVLVDGIQLFKPVLLKGNPGGYTSYKIETQQRKVYGKELTFHGYLVVQEGAQLRPDELRGIMVRIKNVGIGYYDPSFLDYRFNEGPRSRWLTGEIFVDEGLENSLNIDRDSFNRFHPAFKEVQEYIHTLLHEKIFPLSYKQIDVRSSAKAESKAKAREEHLEQVVSRAVKTPVVIRRSSKEVESGQQPLVVVTEKKSTTEISVPQATEWRTKKSSRQLVEAILTIYEVAMIEKTRDRQREVFSKLLLELFSGW